MYFYKLNNTVDINNFEIKNYVASFNLSDDSNFKGTIYHKITNNNHLIDTLVPKKIKFFFQIHHLKINSEVRPHIDHGPKTSINIYLKTNNCKTTFYSFIDETKSKTIPLELSNLKEQDSFVANDGDIWVLDVSKPHGVIPLSNDFKERTAICLQTIIDFETVMNFLKNK
jgi:hypothetical protein